MERKWKKLNIGYDPRLHTELMLSYFYYREALEGERDELAEKMSDMTRAEEIIREKISEKQAEQEAKQAEMDEFSEIKVNKNKNTHSYSCLGKT